MYGLVEIHGDIHLDSMSNVINDIKENIKKEEATASENYDMYEYKDYNIKYDINFYDYLIEYIVSVIDELDFIKVNIEPAPEYYEKNYYKYSIITNLKFETVLEKYMNDTENETTNIYNYRKYKL